MICRFNELKSTAAYDMEENKGENQITERWVIMDLKTKDSFDFKSERRSGKLF